MGAGERAASFELFSETLDAEWIAQALRATGTATIRRRKLPAEYVVWLVIGMGRLRDRSIREVVRHLDLVLPTSGGRRETVSGSAIVQARERLGPEPLATFFAQSAAVWGPAAADAERWRGLAVYGVDGTTVRVPDTPENEAAFGRIPTRWESADMYAIGLLASLCINIGCLLIYRYFQGTREIRAYDASRVGTLALEAVLVGCFVYLALHNPYGGLQRPGRPAGGRGGSGRAHRRQLRSLQDLSGSPFAFFSRRMSRSFVGPPPLMISWNWERKFATRLTRSMTTSMMRQASFSRRSR